MLFKVLGPVEVLEDGQRVEIGGPRQRRLLCSLLAAAGDVVSLDRLVERLWDDDERPEGADRALRSYVARLRRSLGDDGSVIVTRPPGYVFEVGEHEVDVVEFEASLAAADLATDAVVVADRLAKGLALWRGRAFDEFADLEWLRIEAERLEALRLVAIERWFRARLDCGASLDLVPDVERVVVDHPVHEGFRALLMEALWRAGRDADAVRAYQDYRQFVIEETGLEPSEDLKDLETAILTGDRPTPVGVPMVPMPSGTVTFLFTDVEASTQGWEQHPAAMTRAMSFHDEVVRSTTSDHGGYVVKSTGDGALAAFSSAVAGIETAIETQSRFAGHDWEIEGGVAVRMGLHAGVAEERGGDYLGLAVNEAARVMAAANGGQILVSGAVAELVCGSVELRDLGRHGLQGISHPVHLWQAVAPGLATDFPPLPAAMVTATNLRPVETSLIGRDEDVGLLADEIQTHRVVTLTGVGGVGKTRLAQATAASVLPLFPDGVWFVELAALSDPDAIAEAILGAARIPPVPGRDDNDRLSDVMAPWKTLIILDNCEHLLDGVAELVQNLLGLCPDAHFLATSREQLAIPGEIARTVRSLDPASDGVDLFVDRVGASRSGYRLSPAQRDEVRSLCVHLDGIPLAIELAAARARAMSPAELLDRLGHRFRLLAGGRRGLKRQQTMRATIDWSHELLSDSERLVFRRVSVFAGGFDLVGAGATIADAGLDEFDVLDHLASLVDKSMIQVTEHDDVTRYVMLDTFRDYALEQLAASNELGPARRSHAEHYCGVVESITERLRGPDQLAADGALAIDYENLRSAINWTTGEGDIDTFCRLLGPFAAVLNSAPLRILRLARTGSTFPGLDNHHAAAKIVALAVMHHFAVGSLVGEEGQALAHRLRSFPELPPFALRALTLADTAAGRSGEKLALAALVEAENRNDDYEILCANIILALIRVTHRREPFTTDPSDGSLEAALTPAARAYELARQIQNPATIALAAFPLGNLLVDVDPDAALEVFMSGASLDPEANPRVIPSLRCSAGVTKLRMGQPNGADLYQTGCAQGARYEAAVSISLPLVELCELAVQSGITRDVRNIIAGQDNINPQARRQPRIARILAEIEPQLPLEDALPPSTQSELLERSSELARLVAEALHH